ncbi:MAG: copper ion binding protein [Methanomassiliicoccaceae archaeon]|jgi:copper chaperone|nr:copper ion binding protein [Methanomassiliicoccaceae archaeon]
MERSVIKVEGMSCGHCANAVTKAVGTMPGVSNVTVDLKGRTVTAEYDAAVSSLDKIKGKIEDQGFDVIS